jgi:kynureninase
MNFQNTNEFAKSLDAKDELKSYKNEFYFPQHNNQNVIYFTGNSLGLQPKRSPKNMLMILMDDWANMAVEGHFYSDKPWWDYHERFC